jgi:hypothetical protein
VTVFEYKRLGFSLERKELIEDWTATRATGDLNDVFWRRVKELGLEGWDLVGSFGEFLLFKREGGDTRHNT